MNAPVRVENAWFDSLRPILSSGNDVRLLEGGAEYFPALIAEIGLARREVFVETYIFEGDASGHEVALALAAAARRGVSTNLLVDGFGTSLPHDIALLLEQAGVRVATYRPERGRWWPSRKRLRRLHRKLAVVDGAVGFVGGINILDDSNDPNHGRLEAPRLDFAVRVRGPAVAAVHLAAQRLWWQVTALGDLLGRGGEESEAALRLPAPVESEITRAGRMRAMLVLRDNVRFRRSIERQYLRAIRRARREVLIACAYFFPGARFRRALLAAVRRGVRVRLLLQGRIEYPLPHYATQSLYEELLRGGLEIHEYGASFLHAKVAVIDDWATVGSSNIDPFSLLLAREANMVVIDRGFAAQLRRRLAAAIDAGATPVPIDRHQRRSWLLRVVHGFAYLVLRIGVAVTGNLRDY